MAAQVGATTKELMVRLGHASPRAALIYQHAAEYRDRAIADGLEALAAQHHHDLGRTDTTVHARAIDARSSPKNAKKADPKIGLHGPEQDLSSGDDGTRTHDILLANQ
jgi:hypothetical protein